MPTIFVRKDKLVTEAIAGRALSGREVEGKPQAAPPKYACQSHDGDWPADPKGPYSPYIVGL